MKPEALGSRNIVCFDLEGPLTAQDNACELAALMGPAGLRLFRGLRRYDELVVQDGRAGYEPGTTLILLLPFLVCYGLTDAHVLDVSSRAEMIPGAEECVPALRQRGCRLYIVSTSYLPHALRVGRVLGFPVDRIYATRVSLDELARQVSPEDRLDVQRWQERLLPLAGARRPPAAGDERALREALDEYALAWMAQSPAGRAAGAILALGGGRKRAVLETIARQHRATLEDVVFIGDSINDQAALAAVRSAGGLAIAFNATAHALPAATVGIAAPDLSCLVPLIAAWQQGGLEGARRSAQDLSERKEVHCDWLLGASGGILGNILAYHEAMRRRLRRAPADLS